MRKYNSIQVILCTVFILLGISIHAQKNAVNYLDFGVANAEVLTRAYLDPFAGMADANLTSGWNMSPRVMRKGRFSVHYFSNQSLAKSNKELFNIAQLIESNQLSGITLQNPQVFNAPSAIYRFKEGQDLPALNYGGETITVPNGEEINNLQMHSISATVGISFNTDISVRFSPPLEYSRLGKSHMWGVGVKHSLIPYFSFMQKHPFLETSVMLSYSQLKSSNDISYQGQNDQSLELAGKALSARLLIGTHFNIVDLFGSIGYGSRSSDLTFKGSYANIPEQSNNINDPIKLNYDLSAVEYEAGIQLRLYFINLQASYTYSNYGMVSLGAGISFR